MAFFVLNSYATQKAVSTTAYFNTKTSNIKISPMHSSKKSGGSVQKMIPDIFTSKHFLNFSSHMKSWNMTNGAVSSAGSMVTTPMWLKTEVQLSLSMIWMTWRNKTSPILNLSSQWRLAVNFTPQALYPSVKYPHHVWKEAGLVPKPVWEFWRTEKSFCPWQALNSIPSIHNAVTTPSILPGSVLVGLKQNMFPLMIRAC